MTRSPGRVGGHVASTESKIERAQHDASDSLLSVRDLSIAFPMGKRWVEVVQSASLEVRRGEVLGLVGESGSGKTVTSLAILGILSKVGGRVTGGTITFDGIRLDQLRERDWIPIRGKRIAMVFQQASRSLNPAFTIGDQIAEAVRAHQRCSRSDAWDLAVSFLDRVRIPDAAARARDYPHQLSGGMCQRAMIAMALAPGPELLLADEPTTALDVTVQAKVVELLQELQAETGITVVYVTHDLGVVAQLCDRLAVMYAGQTVELGDIHGVLSKPTHPYTEGLLAAVPKTSEVARRLTSIRGRVPPPEAIPAGCRFHPRCDYAVPALCATVPVELGASAEGRRTRCVRCSELTLRGIDG